MRFEQYVGLLARGWEDISNPFEEECPYLLNVYDQALVPEEVSTIFNLEEFGKHWYETFVLEVLLSKEKLFWDPISANKLQLFHYKPEIS